MIGLLNPRVSWRYQYKNMVQNIVRVAKASVKLAKKLVEQIPACVAFATDKGGTRNSCGARTC